MLPLNHHDESQSRELQLPLDESIVINDLNYKVSSQQTHQDDTSQIHCKLSCNRNPHISFTRFNVFESESEIEQEEFFNGSFEYERPPIIRKKLVAMAKDVSDLPPLLRIKAAGSSRNTLLNSIASLKVSHPIISSSPISQKTNEEITSSRLQNQKSNHWQRYKNGGYQWDSEQERILVQMRESGMNWHQICESNRFGPRSLAAIKARYNVIVNRGYMSDESNSELVSDESTVASLTDTRKRGHSYSRTEDKNKDTVEGNCGNVCHQGMDISGSNNESPGSRWTDEDKELLRKMRDDLKMTFEEIASSGRFGQRTLGAIRSYYSNVIRGRFQSGIITTSTSISTKCPRKRQRVNSAVGWTREERRLLIEMRENQKMTFPQLEKSGKFGNRDARAINGYYLSLKRGEIQISEDDQDDQHIKQEDINIESDNDEENDSNKSSQDGRIPTSHDRAEIEQKTRDSTPLSSIPTPSKSRRGSEEKDLENSFRVKMENIYRSCRNRIIDMVDQYLEQSIVHDTTHEKIEKTLGEIMIAQSGQLHGNKIND